MTIHIKNEILKVQVNELGALEHRFQIALNLIKLSKLFGLKKRSEANSVQRFNEHLMSNFGISKRYVLSLGKSIYSTESAPWCTLVEYLFIALKVHHGALLKKQY